MPELPILNAANPTTIPSKTYDRIWVEEIIIRAPDPNADVAGEVKLHKYGIFDGIAELDPNGGQWIRVDNMLSKANEDADLQTAITALLSYVAKLGMENGVIST